ncbi:MAG: Hypothetical protein C75L2_00340005 [Leptospirillum sp. Group II 'C75']|jgi:hypothetical protein|uniref:hypothetical protein n=1 Tax=Leptospirillum sp. Group II 'CF-1' TaxID=1660083 RepID=UPI0000F0CACA|nr:hypothetical protein [Leptospirillum sp. Group II 'CF-1']AKS24101.1 hypothetical protein ABH19_10660 [Leptospirillum sp. Group II 'CF-1']EAY56425.1 MAG: hypothetical protein UBAL2_80620075 [Leptospirillum rubarum]EIJ75062.1 MAG: Hypothetical protein C75L2_00340005 [Leptospirillum sp. Group II 'C75']
MNNENLEKDRECVGSFSVPPPPLWERALGIVAKAERIMIGIGKVGLVLVVVVTAAVAWGDREWAEDLNRQVDVLLKVAASPDRAWVARELAVRGGTDLLPGPGVPTGKFVCGRAGEVPRECTPSPYAARATELCVFPRSAAGWSNPVRPAGVAPGKFGTPRLCPESILHPEK